MAQSLANVLIHVVFSTKDRTPRIDARIKDELYAYLATSCNTCGCPVHQTGGTQDHVHFICTLSRTITISQLIEKVKSASSKWIKTQGTQHGDFAWQNGYGVFSIGQSNLAALKRYIARQEQHHLKTTFQDEFRELLSRYGIEYDERYVWD